MHGSFSTLGKLVKDVSHLAVSFSRPKKDLISIEIHHGDRKAVAALRTVRTIMNNLIIGVTRGFLYKMRYVYAHFPINVNIEQNKETGLYDIEIRNFLGESIVRRVTAQPGVEVIISPNVKDELQLLGNSLEGVSQSAADIQQICRVRNKDIRKLNLPWPIVTRVVEQDLENFPDDPITKPTNRGNKLAVGSQYVREGALGGSHGPQYFRKRVKHAGYERDVLDYNPPVYDSEGDEVEDDVDEAGADTIVENPFADIHLETLLCPLRHPSELETHPSMSEPYRSKVLHQMVNTIIERLKRERSVLFKAKRLHRELLGDTPWMPCGFLETINDRNIFLPGWVQEEERKKMLASNGAVQGQNITTAGQSEPQARQGVEETAAAMSNPPKDPSRHEEGSDGAEKHKQKAVQNGEQNGNQMVNGTGNGSNEQAEDGKSTEEGAARDGSLPQTSNKGVDHSNNQNEPSSPPPVRRMTTRAQVAGTNSQDSANSDNVDDMDEEEDPSLIAHPLYLVPHPPMDRTCGLPYPEAEEMRRVLWAYIQKQDETVRGFEKMLTILLKSKRMKDDVWEWCKAEAHVGELSDNEDWPEYERWGLKVGDLKKGADSDEEIVEDKTTKRSRNRR
ncbi:hypothetical protein KEM55_000865 [Ascosphaera atra]|nr:hypothetical protein KEM55_000865 [Ascosphaera atra]